MTVGSIKPVPVFFITDDGLVRRKTLDTKTLIKLLVSLSEDTKNFEQIFDLSLLSNRF